MMPLTRICDANSQQLIQNVADDLNSMATSLVADGVANKEPATRRSRCAPHFRVVVFKIWQGALPHELVQDVA